MASKTSAETRARDPFTYTDLVRLGSLNVIDPVPAAIQVLTEARRVEGERAQVYSEAQDSARDPQLRRTAAHRIAEARVQLVQAQEAVALALRGLAAARVTAFQRVSPILRGEHQRVLAELGPVLAQVEAMSHRLIQVESVAGAYTCHRGDIGPSRSALPAEVGSLILMTVQHWLRQVLPWHKAA